MPALFNLQFFGNFSLVAINALFSIFLIRLLTDEEYGIYGFLVGFLSISLFLTNFGLSGVVQKRIPTSKDEEKSGIFYSFVLLKIFAQLIFVTILGAYLFHSDSFNVQLLSFFLVYLFFSTLNNFILMTFFIINLQQKSSFYNLIFTSALKFISLIWVNSFFEISILQIFLILASAELLSFIISFISWPSLRNIKYPNLKVYLEAKPFMITKIFELFFLPSIAIFFLTYFYGFSEVAKFKAIITIALVVIANTSLIQRFEFLMINIEKGRLMEQKAITFFKEGIFLVFAAISISILSFMLIFPEVISNIFFANKYSDAVYFLPLISFCVLLNHISYLFSPYIYKENKEHIFPKATLTGSIVYILSCIILIPNNGFIGAIMALCLGYVTKPIFFSFLYLKEIKYLFTKKIAIFMLSWAFCMFFIMWIIKIINGNIILDITIFLMGFISMLFISHYFLLPDNFFKNLKLKFEAVKLNE